ncbi:MAG: hypothetical protein GXP28_03900 [Planctomycetes bacterium]|nr:hypothetical protein [Planctomycetota bacterium]
MSPSIFSSERLTAIVSTMVATAILAAGVTAHQSLAPLDELERLESDLQFQLDWAFRHDAKERSQRITKLEETIEAWHASPRSQEDRKLLTSWLSESTVRSMPGTTKPLPEVPEFGKPPVVALAQPKESKIEQAEPIENEAMQLTELADLRATPANHVALVTNPEPSRASEKPVRINLTELAARIAGYHEGLDQIETTLLLANSPDLDFLKKLELLEEQAKNLDDLTRDFRFVNLYHESLTEKERGHMNAPRSANATLVEIERLLRRNERQQDGDFLGSFDPIQRKRIENLRQQLATTFGRMK